MTPDDRSDADEPTRPLPVEPEPTEAMVAPHVPVADVAMTAPTAPVGAGPTGRLREPGRPRGLMWGLIAAIALLGTAVIVFGTMWLQRDDGPLPGLSPSPSVTTSPSQTPATEAPPEETPIAPAPPQPEPEPTEPAPPDPTDTPIPHPSLPA